MTAKIEKQKLKLVIQRFLQGDSTQYRILRTKITQYIYHQHFGSDSEKNELISGVIEILLDNLRQKKFQGDSLAALNVYIYKIIKNRIGKIDRRRKQLVYMDEPPDIEVDHRPTPAEEVADRELADKVLDAMDLNCRDLLILKFQEGWLDQEIADHMKKSKNAISTAISRCLKKARELEVVKEIM